MAGLMLNGSMIQGLVYNGNPVSAMYNGQLIWPTASPLPTYERAYLVMGWNKVDNWTFGAGFSANSAYAPWPSVVFSGQYYQDGAWHTIENKTLSGICNQTDYNASTYGNSAKFFFSGTPSSGWKSIAWQTNPYWQPTGAVTAEVWGSAGNFQRCMGSATFNIAAGQTHIINLA